MGAEMPGSHAKTVKTNQIGSVPLGILNRMAILGRRRGIMPRRGEAIRYRGEAIRYRRGIKALQGRSKPASV